MDGIKRTAAATGAAILLALAAGVAQASVLTFDGPICTGAGGATCANGSTIGQGYGDTAGVDVRYDDEIHSGGPLGAAGSELHFWGSGYGDLTNVAWGSAANGLNGVTELFLAPVGGDTVTLASLDLAGLAHSWSSFLNIVDGNGATLFSSGPITIGFPHNHFDFNLSSTTGIGIEWGSGGGNVGIDNVSFGSIAPPPPPPPSDNAGVPEPASWALMLMGFFGLGGMVRRQRAVQFA